MRAGRVVSDDDGRLSTTPEVASRVPVGSACLKELLLLRTLSEQNTGEGNGEIAPRNLLVLSGIGEITESGRGRKHYRSHKR